MVRLYRTALLSIAFPLAATHASAQLVKNGSFEQGPAQLSQNFGLGPYQTIPVGSTLLTSWNVFRGNVDITSASVWQATDGTRSLDMGGTGTTGGIYQQLSLTRGTGYRLTFDLSGNFLADGVTKHLDLYLARDLAALDGSATATFSVTRPALWSRANMQYQTITYDFVAATDAVVLAFVGRGTTAAGPALDNVSLTPVTTTPEPASLALVGGGLVLVGAAARRRRPRTVA